MGAIEGKTHQFYSGADRDFKIEEDAPFIEVEIEEEEDDFVPPAFIPQGIDLDNNDAPMEDAPVGDEPPAFPFAPLP